MNANAANAAVGAVLGAVPSGLYVLVCGGEYAVVSWVQQAGFAPPAISVALNRERAVARGVLGGALFMLSALPEGGLALAKPFLAGDAAGVQAALDDQQIVRGALAWLRCRYRTHARSGDHEIIVADVLDGARLVADAKPYVHLRRNGFNY